MTDQGPPVTTIETLETHPPLTKLASPPTWADSPTLHEASPQSAATQQHKVGFFIQVFYIPISDLRWFKVT